MPVHTEQCFLDYTQDQVFQLVADVDHYPDFLPWCLDAVVHKKKPHFLEADLIVGFPVFNRCFRSHVILHAPNRIDVLAVMGPFRYLKNYWIFNPWSNGGCEVIFFIDFEFKNKIFNHLMNKSFGEAACHMLAAFKKRAQDIYAPTFFDETGSKISKALE